MKKGYFFTLDAFIAMTMLVLCIVLIFSLSSQKPYPLQGIFLSDDLMYLLSSTKLIEIQNPYLDSLYLTGKITDKDNSILEQIAIFYVTNRLALADSFAVNVTQNLIPEKYGFELRIYNETKTYTTQFNPGIEAQSKSRFITVSKKIIFGTINNTIAWGPMVAEVRLWQ